VKRAAGGGGGDADDEAADDAGDTNVVDLMPRTDISGHITDTLIAELNDKNWKVRRDRRLRRRVFFCFWRVIFFVFKNIPRRKESLVDSLQISVGFDFYTHSRFFFIFSLLLNEWNA